MNDGAMHDIIRALYQGVIEPHAWQRCLQALCDFSASAQASLLVVDTEHGTILARQTVDQTPQDTAAPPARQHLQNWHRFAGTLSVGGWYIDRHEVAGIAASRQAYGDGTSDHDAPATFMACLVNRDLTHEIYLKLQRPSAQGGYSEDDTRALDWAIPHLREAISLRDRAYAATMLGQMSASLLNRLSFGVIVFAESGKALLANELGAPWVQRLLPALAADVSEAMLSASGGWHLSRPFPDVMRALTNPAAHHPVHALQAIGADGRSTQIVAMALTPAMYQSSAWQGRAVLATVHESHLGPYTEPVVLRDLFGLTPAENRLATLLTAGMGLPEACAQLGIKRETSRSQLKSIFTKTSTGTQAQLAHLLTRLGCVLAKPAA